MCQAEPIPLPLLRVSLRRGHSVVQGLHPWRQWPRQGHAHLGPVTVLGCHWAPGHWRRTEPLLRALGARCQGSGTGQCSLPAWAPEWVAPPCLVGASPPGPGAWAALSVERHRLWHLLSCIARVARVPGATCCSFLGFPPSPPTCLSSHLESAIRRIDTQTS